MLRQISSQSFISTRHFFPLLFCSCMGGSSSKAMSGQPFTVAAQASRNTATLIFLHGLGDTGQGWAEAFKQLKLQNVKCIFPNASINPVTLNYGMKMPSWFDIKGLSMDSPEDEDGIKAASQMLNHLIANEEKEGISSENVYVGGFSQGGAVALYTALTSQKKLAGIVGLSTWLPLNKQFPQALGENRDIPMFQGHGEDDPLVPLKWGELSGKLVQQMTSKHTFKTYPGLGHSSCQEEMEDVKNFFTSQG
ncbi:acyl-protein thioesterase 1-like [Mya arenaria]|uniref:acyl-protein thioesterase 1-like n=1 Tax=Mya arenaria TaxID=6604 RepID=UPI0022E46F57|nr:acyl-protein thioesterase 1-like [Mya arenaria]